MDKLIGGIWQALTHTPWWIYVCFVIVVFIGIQSLKTRLVKLPKIFILPIAFAFLSIDTLVTHFAIDIFSVSTFSLSLFLGCLIGWLQVYNLKVRFDKQKNLVEVPGNWTTLTNVTIIFLIKYYFGYELSVDPQLMHNNMFELSLLAANGITTGMFVGRLAWYLVQRHRKTHVDLQV